MSTLLDGICPLCSRVYRQEQLHSHIAGEQPRVRERTIEVIQAYHKDWASEHGACEPCWRGFRDASCVLSILKQTKPQYLTYGVKPAKLSFLR